MTGRLARILRALAADADLLRRRRELRLLVFGQSTSLLGSMITLVAIPVQVYELTGSTVAVGLLGVAEFVPILALALVGGALADAFDRRRLVVLAEVGAIFVRRPLHRLCRARSSPSDGWLWVVASRPGR